MSNKNNFIVVLSFQQIIMTYKVLSYKIVKLQIQGLNCQKGQIVEYYFWNFPYKIDYLYFANRVSGRQFRLNKFIFRHKFGFVQIRTIFFFGHFTCPLIADPTRITRQLRPLSFKLIELAKYYHQNKKFSQRFKNFPIKKKEKKNHKPLSL